MKLKEVVELWRIDKQQFVKRSTLAAYLNIMFNHILPVFGEKTSITEEEIQDFVVKKVKESGLSKKTVKDMTINLKMLLKFAYKKKLWQTIPILEDIRIPSDDKPQKNVETLSQHDYSKLVTYVTEHFTFRNLGILIVLNTGMRIGEVCALKWGDINLEEGTITIGSTLQRIYEYFPDGTKKTSLIIDTPKTSDSAREIPISKNLMGILKPLMKIANNKDFFVLTNSHKPDEPRTYRKHYYAIAELACVKIIKFHGMRHSFATSMIKSNVDVKTVSSILGHSKVSLTLDLYVHPDRGTKKSAIDSMFKKMKV